MTADQDPRRVQRGQLPARRRGSLHGWHRVSRLAVTLAVLLAVGLGVLAVLASTGRAIRLPVWAVAEIEARLNRTLAAGTTEAPAVVLSLGGVQIVVPEDWVPRFQLEDVRLRQAGGQTLVRLPEARITIDPVPFAKGQLRVRTIALVGAHLSLRRDAAGAFDLVAGTGNAALADDTSFAALLDAGDAVFLSPALASLDRVDVEGLSLTLADTGSGRRWELGDGRLVLERQAETLAGELSATLIEGGKAPAKANIVITSSLADSSATLAATVTDMAAHDVAAMSAPLAFLAVLDAPISGRIAGSLDKDGTLAGLEGALDLGAGALRPEGSVAPLSFEKAGMALTYDPATADVTLTRLSVQSQTVRLNATGHVYLRDHADKAVPAGLVPDVILAQAQFTDVEVDPEGLFETPVRFSTGALDMRVTLQPFRVEIGQLALAEGAEHLMLSGDFGTREGGWASKIDVALDQIRHERLVKLWPLRLVPKTRDWLVSNVQSGNLFNVKGALRTAPGQDPVFSLGYEFAGIDVRFLRGLPPISAGSGRASVEGQRYVMALDRGHLVAPKGGKVVADGSVFEVPDISQRPTRANITLVTSASLTATLSILDEPPFRFLSKAGQLVDLGEGQADLVTKLSLPLLPKVMPNDVTYSATGTIRDVASSVVVPGRQLAADLLRVDVTREGLRLAGIGTLDGAAFDANFSQGFGPDAKGKSRIDGEMTLTDATLRAFGIVLPPDTLTGAAVGRLELDLEKGVPGRLRITSDLQGLAISIPALGWRKGRDGTGALAVDLTLGPLPEVTALTLTAPGLAAKGQVTLRPAGGLDTLALSSLTVGDWLDVAAEIKGQGAGRAVAVAVTGGSVDLRRMPKTNASGGGGPPLSLRLDEVVIASGISLTALRGEIADKGGVTGDFVSGVNGIGRIQGAVVPGREGSTVRIRSDNAGQILAAAGIFAAGRGGGLELVLRARGTPGAYDGTAAISSIRVVDAPVLASLLNAISVIGILEQLNGEGLLFSNVDLDFRMETGAVQISRGAAIGASMGVSFAGLYDSERKAIDLQGTVSPFYLLNGVGAIFSRRGEGLFGFNYRLRGSADSPQVSVNPLSILTPGMFRDIFRSAPPTLRNRRG